MLIVALTGGIGSGKSLAGEYLASFGAVVVDSDQLARDVVERGAPAFDEILARFGDEILTDGLINRRRLGEIIFADPDAKLFLESVTHPRIRAAFEAIVHSCESDDVIVNQIPLLVETAGRARFDFVISIAAPIEIRRERCIARGLKSYEFDKRNSAQASDEERSAVSDVTIDNSGDQESLLRALEELWESQLKPRALAGA